MLRQSRLSGFFKQQQPKIVESKEYTFTDTQKESQDFSKHRSVNSFDRYSSVSKAEEYKLYTHAQLESSLESLYGVQGQQLINICLDQNIIHAAGGKQFITKYSQKEIYDKLNESVPGLKKIADHKSQLSQVKAKGKDLQDFRANEIQHQDRFAQRSKRSGSLTTDDLRKIPSYSFCLHPDLKIALSQLEQNINQAQQSGIVNTRLAEEWQEGIKNIKSEKDYDNLARKVKAYLGK